jgi:lysophospholipid acyltransferase (LPLAT)-like uncharacterized protein
MATPRIVKRIIASETVQWIASAIGAGYVLLVRLTSRIDLPPPPEPGPFIIAMWHGRLAMLHLLRFGDRPLVALISGHRDGRLISKCAWHYNIATVTGSSSRGGIGAARKLIRLAREGHWLFITPDGPRGPCMRANENIVDLSLLTELPILPAAISTSDGKELATWDKFLVPVPFSRIAVRWGEPFRVQRGDDVAAACAHLEAKLNALQQSADCAVGRTPALSVAAVDVLPRSGEENRNAFQARK